jgi:hypothetical protein
MYQPKSHQVMALHQYANGLGLKSGMYYLRVGTGIDPIKIEVDASITKYIQELPKGKEKVSTGEIMRKSKETVCTDEICLMCQ